MKRIAGAVAAVVLGAGVTGAGYAVAAREQAQSPLGPGHATVQLDAHYSRFSRDEIVVRRGTLVRFVVHNEDPIRHEFIVGPPGVHARHAAGTEARHPPVPGEVSVEPSETAETVYRFDQVGSMTFACHLPGHFEYGMHGEVRVVE